MKVSITLTGTTPLVMHNIQLSDPTNSFSRAISELTSKKDKTLDDMLEIQRLEFMGSLYVGQSGIVMPAANIHRCLVKTAAARREGKSVERALLYTATDFPVEYNGPTDLTALWEATQFRFQTAVRVGQARVQRMRPRFPNWRITSEWELLTDMLDLSKLQRIVREAGLIEGLGEHRTKGSGRFEGTAVSMEVKIKAAAE